MSRRGYPLRRTCFPRRRRIVVIVVVRRLCVTCKATSRGWRATCTSLRIFGIGKTQREAAQALASKISKHVEKAIMRVVITKNEKQKKVVSKT